jgi:hypothetical protein
MILATWNCQARDDLSVVSSFDADVLVLTEPRFNRLPPEYKSLWIGENGKKGIAIIPSLTTTLVQIMDIPALPSQVILAHVTGSISFLLLAVWTQKKDEYVEGLHRALDLCEKRMASYPTVIMGDFNSNAIWDHERKRKDRGVSHTDLVRRLDDLGLVSAYHVHFAEKQGQETLPTYYHCKKKQKKWPSHIDYCFLPKTWAVTDVTVGTFEEWRAFSDHMPLVVTVDEQQPSSLGATPVSPTSTLVDTGAS